MLRPIPAGRVDPCSLTIDRFVWTEVDGHFDWFRLALGRLRGDLGMLVPPLGSNVGGPVSCALAGFQCFAETRSIRKTVFRILLQTTQDHAFKIVLYFSDFCGGRFDLMNRMSGEELNDIRSRKRRFPRQ